MEQKLALDCLNQLVVECCLYLEASGIYNLEIGYTVEPLYHDHLPVKPNPSKPLDYYVRGMTMRAENSIRQIIFKVCPPLGQVENRDIFIYF